MKRQNVFMKVVKQILICKICKEAIEDLNGMERPEETRVLSAGFQKPGVIFMDPVCTYPPIGIPHFESPALKTAFLQGRNLFFPPSAQHQFPMGPFLNPAALTSF